MLTCHVVVSRQSDRSAPCPPLPATSHVTKFPVVHPLSIQQVTKCFSRNFFVLKTIHFDGGCIPLCGAAPHDRHPLDCLSPFSIPYPLCIHILPHSFALFCTHQKLNSFLFKRFRTPRQKTARGGVPLRFFSRTKMNRTRPNYSSIGRTRCRLHRQPTSCVCSPRPRFVSHPHSFLLNYIDPILPRVGPAGHFPYSTQRPGS